jgi:hypothetical protein
MSQTRSSYEPARLTAGQAATTAPDGAVGPALGHVRGEGGRDPQPEQPAGQAGYRQPVPGRVHVRAENLIHVMRPGGTR